MEQLFVAIWPEAHIVDPMLHVVRFPQRRLFCAFAEFCCAVAMVFAGTSLGARADNTPIAAHDFAPRSGPAGATMFTRLPSAQTGVVTENRFDDPRMWNEKYLEFTVGAIGSGVAIGDYDNDGKPDIFVVNKTGPNALFRNLGNWKFENVTDKAGVAGPSGAWKQGVTFADINNDGLLDLYVCRFEAPNLLYINQGNGTFAESAHAFGLDVVDACGMAAFCDYDRDGFLDVYIQTNLRDATGRPNGERDYLFHNNRNGTFTNVTDRAGISGETQGHSATWWDYDNDGWPDLYVANDFAAPDTLYHNNGDGTFTNTLDRVVPHTPHSSMGADLGDVNNDGLVDFFVTDMAATTHEKDQRTMANERERTTTSDDRIAPQQLWNALFLNTDTGVMQEAAKMAGLAATDWTWAARFEDLDNDGRLDLYVTNGMVREETNADLLAKMMTAESATERVRLLRNSPLLAERHLAYQNLGDLQFKEVGSAWGLDQTGVGFGAAFGDLDGDGDLDLVYASYESGVTVLRNDGRDGHSLIVDLRGTTSNKFGVGAVVKIETDAGVQVRPLVLARGYLSSSEPAVHFGLGQQTKVRRLTVEWPSGKKQELDNLDVDRRLTLTEPEGEIAPVAAARPAGARSAAGQFTEISAQASLGITAREEAVDETAQQRLLPFRHNRRGPALAVGDVTGDGEDDVIFGGTTLDVARLLIKTGANKFTAPLPLFSATATVNDGPVLVFDADGDGRSDILVTRGGASLPDGTPDYQPVLLLNRGNGLAPADAGVLPQISLNVGAAAAADFDRDGHLDVFLGGRLVTGDYPLPARSVLLAGRGNHLEDVTDLIAPALREIGMVTGVVWSDVDGDGWQDLVLTLEWGGVKYFHNDQGKRLVDSSEQSGFAAAGTGWWSGIATADFNGDGKPDFVVGNVGLNTPYRASATQPALIYYGDFGDGSSGPQILEAKHDGDRIVPWRNRKQVSIAVKSVAKRYPKTDDFARASLPEIVGEKKLAAAERFVATEFRSGVFLSQADGTYRFASLPRMAQIAPVFGIAAGDFDGDGNADIYVVQNSFAPIPQIGRFDGGVSQLLRGDGHGDFAAVPPAESNLVVTGDAKALSMLDLDDDGWPDFLVTRNNNAALAFRNKDVAGRHSIAVVLRGEKSNAAAIGARVTLEFSDGAARTEEIHAGAGYYSQSSAVCFFGYKDGVVPKRAKIRWPSGATTTSDIAQPAAKLIFSQAAE
ncbi:MAG TPA: FG-GAP-like repeat-containing protein [Opitutaceae bacterium]|nr:FG-GAP-like repeat-containing protein [Opitutaceae bacterium]